jgi:hypothetical protein
VLLLEKPDEPYPGDMPLAIPRAGPRGPGGWQQSLLDVEVHRPWCYIGFLTQFVNVELGHHGIMTAIRLTVKS